MSEDESSSEESEEEVEEEGDVDGDEAETPVKKKKLVLIPPKKSIFDQIQEIKDAKNNNDDQKPKKVRRCVMNIACTEYEIIEKVAKKCNNFRIKEFEEDHDGAIVNGQHNQKLRKDWDVSWHDLGITADYLTKMEPYQKINQYPGMYQITRKNYLARNLMKM